MGGQRTSVRNCRTMAVFLGPRQTTAEEREGRRSARDIAWRDPIGLSSSWLAPAADSDGGRGGSVAPSVSAFPVDAVGAASPFRVCG